MTSSHTIRGVTYSVDASLLNCLVAAFDVWRDGLGKFSGTMGKQAFLHGTSDIVLRSILPDNRDPYLQQRYLRVLRHVLSSRPRKAKSSSILVAQS